MKRLYSLLFSGGTVLFISMTIVNGGNYVFNLLLGRWLGPEAFADLSLVVTLMLMITFITATFQLTAAKFAAGYSATNHQQRLGELQKVLYKQATIWGIAAFVIIAGGAQLWQQFFNTASPWPFVILGFGMPIYLMQGVDRGIHQGEMNFQRLALSYQAEMWVRLALGLLFVAMGWSVSGAVFAITLSFAATWLIVFKPRWQSSRLPQLDQHRLTAFAGPVILVQLSQILINNSDVLIVKRFFIPQEAGEYAALALIGRIVFFATWSVVPVIFPIVAQRHEKGEEHRSLLFGGLALVSAVSAGIIGMVYFFPTLIVQLLFGEAYLEIAPLLWLYAIATSVYALSNVVINYHLSLNNNAGTWIALIGGILQVVLLTLFHNSLRQVVTIQIILMGIMFLVLLGWDLIITNQPNAQARNSLSNSDLGNLSLERTTLEKATS